MQLSCKRNSTFAASTTVHERVKINFNELFSIEIKIHFFRVQVAKPFTLWPTRMLACNRQNANSLTLKFSWEEEGKGGFIGQSLVYLFTTH